MNADEERAALKSAYPGEEWQKKVKSMSDSQVVAIYRRLKGQGVIK